MMKKLELVIHGKRVVAEDYRLFLVEKALISGIKGFSATNYRKNGKEMIVVKLEGTEGQLEEFICAVRSSFPKTAELEEIVQRCIDTYVMRMDKFQMLIQFELWCRFAAAASGNKISARHMVYVENESTDNPCKESQGSRDITEKLTLTAKPNYFGGNVLL